MTNNSESNIKLVPYKELGRKKALDYYYANREVIMEKNRNRYRQWYNRQSPEKKKQK